MTFVGGSGRGPKVVWDALRDPLVPALVKVWVLATLTFCVVGFLTVAAILWAALMR